MLLLPMAVPAYLGAYIYLDYLTFAGPVQTWLREANGWQRGDYWFPDFSSPGANLLVSAFADNTSNYSSIRTTSANGDSAYTSAFGGTSAAAPQITGVVALMLEANDSQMMRWNVDALFAVHDEMHGHTGGAMTVGKDSTKNQ